MAINDPNITFLFPYRWMKEDRDYFDENIKRQVNALFKHSDADKAALAGVLAYRVLIHYQYHKPMNIPFTKPQAQKALKKVFPNGKCLSVDFAYEQHRSKTMLPLCDFRIYF